MAKLKPQAKTITPRQAGMIAVLGVVLIGAIYWPADDAATLDAGPGPGTAPRLAAARFAAQRAQAQPKTKKRPQVDLDAALRHDPFSSSLLIAQTVTTETDDSDAATLPEPSADLLALQQDGVSMIVRDGGDMIATVGERTLRVGDVIDGYRVVAIEMDGVVLERATNNGSDDTRSDE
ncbi:MAG: hypothetical protein ACREHD_02735 [Pirellulales bacterium]